MQRIEINVVTGEKTIIPLTDAEIAEAAAWAEANKPTYQELRRNEYPLVGDQLDAIMKWVAITEIALPEELKAVSAACMAVKAKYPKPQGGK